MNMKNEESVRQDISSVKRDFTVMVYELDMNFSSSMPVICNYLQEVGITHGMMITDDAGITAEDMVFVLTRLHVKMERYPVWNEKVSIRSWLSPVKDRYVIRNFEITGKDGRLLGCAINSATPFNIKKRSPGEISGDVTKVQTLDIEPALPHNFEKLESVISPEYENNIEVRYYDCDFYHHVNNVKYVQWCIETLPSEFLKNYKCCEVDINFRAEGNIGDKLIVKTVSAQEQGIFNHSITGSSGEKDLVRMRSVWIK
jgi:acyl-ACP thioesterase